MKRNSTWIISRLAKREQHQATAREPLSTSSVIALWGKPITVQDALDHNFASPAPRPKQATFASFMDTDESDEGPQAKRRAILDGLTSDELQAHISQLYTTEVTAALRDIVHAYEITMSVAVSRVSVRSMKTRWGSCTPKTGAIRIARELAAYPIECLDMVVAHELVHLLEPSHNQRFTSCSTHTAPTMSAFSALKQPPIETY
ncbi:MAG: M48 family metallopeptidase [Collinsella sp.]